MVLQSTVIFAISVSSPSKLFAVGALAGIAVHNFMFKYGEWHVRAPDVVLVHLLVLVIPLIRSLFLNALDRDAVVQAIGHIGAGYLGALFTSIAVYRLVFHRLARAAFPGPAGARFSKLWHAWACSTSQNHRVLSALHVQYGDFVRTGPNEVTVFHPGVFSAIDGLRSECIKSDWYDILYPNLSLVTSRIKGKHQNRRQLWKRAFTARALAQHEQRIIGYVDRLDTRIEADAVDGEASNATELFYWFGFDAMGDFVLNKSFDMLHSQNTHHIIKLLQSALSLLGPCGPVPWIVQLGLRLMPRVGVLKDWHTTVSWCEEQMQEQMKDSVATTQAPSMARHLTKEARPDDSEEETWTWLKGDSLLAIVAGSQPVASTLVFIFFELAQHPEHTQKIYEELKDIDVRDIAHLRTLIHLDGEDCFVKADEFVPERWNDKPEMVLNKAAYAPFGTGNHGCIGKYLALDIMKMATARLVKRYHVHLAPGESRDRFFRDWKDQFTSRPGQLRLVFRLRKEMMVL
ncbi:MAG: hypothetical protein Q9185_007120 [Variospora sp. 1 TL-2023]